MAAYTAHFFANPAAIDFSASSETAAYIPSMGPRASKVTLYKAFNGNAMLSTSSGPEKSGDNLLLNPFIRTKYHLKTLNKLFWMRM